MHQSSRKIGGGFDASFQLVESSLIINITHPLKNRVYFSRISDDSLPEHLRQIADSTKELYELIHETSDDKMMMNANDCLVILVDVGKKVKEYVIAMEKVDISSEEALKKKVEDLEKELEKTKFEAKFYKEQFQFLLQHLQLKPDIPELEKIYHHDIASFFLEKQIKMSKSQSMFEKELEKTMSMSASSISYKSQKVGASQIEKEPLKCLNKHPLIKEITPHAFFKCNVCRIHIKQGDFRYHCRPCDFDVCQNCIAIPPQSRKYCQKSHALNYGAAKNYLVRSCDICKGSLAFSKGFTCLECDYDICQVCSK